jgi:CIC family chloride channel protein
MLIPMKNLWCRVRLLFSPTENQGLLLLSGLVGVGTGAAAGLFIRLVDLVQFWPAVDGRARLFSLTLTWPLLLTIPALGGLLCGAVLKYLDPAVKGTGTPEILFAIRRKGGHIGGRYTAVKTLASVFTVCSGGAAGPEAPMVTVGAGLGSWAGRRLGISTEDLRTLVAAGAAAGFAAVFNAPIAGVLFAIEVLLKEFASQSFAMVMLATVSASVTTHVILGERVFVEVPSTYAFNRISELGFYLILAVLAGAFAKLFVATSLFIDKRFEKSVASPMTRAALGGLLLGGLGLLLPQALGNGHLVIPDLIRAEAGSPWAWTLLLALLFGKMVACPLTVGSGGSGGIFIPYLLMGAALGGLVGRVVHLFFPWAAPPGAYMLVGMGAVFGGITFAPFTAILLLFELTRDYSIILPMMFTVGITVMIARAIDPHSLEGHKLLKKGVRLNEDPELRVLEKYHVRDIMSHPPGSAGERKARQLAHSELPVVGPDEPLEHAIRRMQESGSDRVLVVEPAVPGEVVGQVTQGDILSIYRRFFD